tara:strand:+ start:9462 stop:9986 length:525 start_codon:yes stop_codon:yes gene_type:complete
MDNKLFIKNKKNILFIEGINITKINNEIYNISNDNINNEEQEIIDNIYIKNNKIYDKINKIFTKYDLWEINNLSCWYCCLNFNNKSIFIPKTIKKEYIEVYGNFCSFGCALKYINIYYKLDDNKRCQIINNLKYLYKEFYKTNIDIIIESPDKELIDKFGGHLTQNEFKKKIIH